MATTIRIDENIKQQLKLKSAQTGISQLDLANKYILNGLNPINCNMAIRFGQRACFCFLPLS